VLVVPPVEDCVVCADGADADWAEAADAAKAAAIRTDSAKELLCMVHFLIDCACLDH